MKLESCAAVNTARSLVSNPTTFSDVNDDTVSPSTLLSDKYPTCVLVNRPTCVVSNPLIAELVKYSKAEVPSDPASDVPSTLICAVLNPPTFVPSPAT